MTNQEYAKSTEDFQKACDSAHTPATKRQASKWRRKKGLAYKKMKMETLIPTT